MECLSVLVQKKNWKTSFSSLVLLRLGIFIAVYFVYIALGAFIFWALEGSSEKTGALHLYNIRDSILKKNPDMEQDLQDFEQALKQANGITNYIIYNETYESNWSIGKSVFFVGALLTTIGYGQVTPQTVSGKVFTIIYATIGIPMTLILLSAFVERLLVVVMKALLLLESLLFQFYGQLVIRLIHLGIVLIFLVTVFLFVPAMIIFYIESQWDLLDSFYYCFTSLTTIGLGDLIPGDGIYQTHRDLYKIGVTVYLYVGVTLMMLIMAIIYDIPEIKISSMFSSLEDIPTIEGDDLEREKALHKVKPPTRMNRDAVMEKARLSRPSLGLGLMYGLDSNIGCKADKYPEKISSTHELKTSNGN